MIKLPKDLSDIVFYIVPIAPASLFAYRLIQEFGELPLFVSLPIALASVVALEYVGIKSGHAVANFWTAGDHGRTFVSSAFLIAYVTIAVSSILGYFPYEVGLFFIVGVSYLLRGMIHASKARETAVSDTHAYKLNLQNDARQNAEKARIRAEERAERQADKQANLDHELKTKELAVKAKLRSEANQRKHEKVIFNSANTPEKSTNTPAKSTNTPAKSTNTPAKSTKLYECICGKVYEKPNSYTAHTRHCKAFRENKKQKQMTTSLNGRK